MGFSTACLAARRGASAPRTNLVWVPVCLAAMSACGWASPPDDRPPVGENAASTELGDSMLSPTALLEVLNSYAQRRTSAKSLFAADFDSTAQARRQWDELSGVELTGPRAAEPVPMNAALLDPERGRGAVMTSRPISLYGVRAAELRYATAPRDVAGALFVEYLNETGTWCVLDYVIAEPGDTASFAHRLRLLPEDALHPGFRLRIRVSPEAAGAWYVDEIAIAERVESRIFRLSIAGFPIERFPFDLFTDDPEVTPRETAPVARDFPSGTRVYLVAPPTVADAGFDHWSFDSTRPDDPSRAVLLDVGEDTEVTAHFRTDREADPAAIITVRSEPLRAVSLSTGLDSAARFARQDTPFRMECRVGESLALSTAMRTEQLAFEGWIVDGRFAGERPDLEIRVAQDTEVVARFVLIGDMNADGVVDKYDVDLFVLAVGNPDAYDARFPELDRVLRGDSNGDGVLDEADIERFIDLVVEE